MRIKLKNPDVKLPSHGSHQGFPRKVWEQLNSGKAVTWSAIPDKCKDKVEEVKASSPKTSSKKKQEVEDGK